MDLASARHELLGVALESFVTERNRLAGELQAAGQKGAAAELRKMRKPPATTWALNQVARRHPAAMEKLFEAGERMAEAHQTVASSEEFRETSIAYRQAISSVVAAAQKALEGAGHGTDVGTARRMERTLQQLPFAPADQRAAARTGDMEGEIESGDIFDAGRLELAPVVKKPAAPSKGAPSGKSDAARGKADEAARREERERQAKALRAAALNAARVADRAAKAAEKADEDVVTARGRVDTAGRILRDAEHAYATAKDRVEQARKDLAAAETAAVEAKKAARDAAAASARAGKTAADND